LINKHVLFFVCAIGCLLLCMGTGFATEKPGMEGFLNNNSLSLLQNAPAVNGVAAEKTFHPAAFSLPEASLDRLDNPGMGMLLTEGDLVPAAKPKSAKKKVGKILAIAGLGAAGVGTIMLVANGGNDPKEIGSSGMGINWKATGIAWIAVGLAVAVAGFILGAK
jgi:hypothetical protein